MWSAWLIVIYSLTCLLAIALILLAIFSIRVDRERKKKMEGSFSISIPSFEKGNLIGCKISRVVRELIFTFFAREFKMSGFHIDMIWEGSECLRVNS